MLNGSLCFSTAACASQGRAASVPAQRLTPLVPVSCSNQLMMMSGKCFDAPGVFERFFGDVGFQELAQVSVYLRTPAVNSLSNICCSSFSANGSGAPARPLAGQLLGADARRDSPHPGSAASHRQGPSNNAPPGGTTVVLLCGYAVTSVPGCVCACL